MNKTLLLAGVAACLFAANANAVETKQYVSGKLTYADAETKIKDEDETAKLNDKIYGVSVAYGAKMDALRAEVELNLHQKAKKTFSDWEMKTSMENESVMFNAYYDIDTGTKFTPYVGAGLGVARLKFKATDLGDGATDSKSKTNVAWQLGAGVSYAATDNVAVDLGYRYVDYGTFSNKGVDEEDGEPWKTKFDTSANEFYLGARYAF